MMKKICTYFLLLCLLCSAEFCLATITIISVHVTPSTCPNNGTATIFASSTSDSAVFLYNVVAGPVLYPQQNDSTFASLYPGTYTAWVHDINSYDSTQTTFTITGNYQTPIISATPVAPLCLNGNNGEIIGHVTPGSGLAPYSWQVFSPFTGTPQASDTLRNLAAGSYIIKVTDACNVARTTSCVIDTGGTGLAIYSEPVIRFIGCNTAAIVWYFYLNKDKAYLPVKVEVTTSTGTYLRRTFPVPYDTFFSPGIYFIRDTLTNIHFGDYFKICVTDTCNNTICNPQDTIAPFRFSLAFNSSSSNCVAGYSGTVQFKYYASEIAAIVDYSPLTITLENTTTQVVVDSFVVYDSVVLYGGIHPSIPPQPVTAQYLLTVRDGCGNSYQEIAQWAPPPSISAYGSSTLYSCLDSTGGSEFYFNGFGSAVTLEILSGPSSSHSTKPKFAYRDTLIYPIFYKNIAKNPYIVENMPAGTYTYRAFDSCGNVFTDSVVISMVNSFGWIYTIHNNCNGLNTLNMLSPTALAGGLDVYDLTNNTFIQANITHPPLIQCQSLLPGKYRIYVDYQKEQDTLLTGNNYCWTYLDTVIIPSYNDSTLKATDVATCNGTIYLHVVVDSSNGILPFKYEIITGPETFAPQDSSNFVVHYFGTYLMGVIDSCGNVDTRQVSVDSGRFDPVARNGGLCPGSVVQLAELSSPYFSYVWKKPGGAIYTGDTLIINPFTVADTGLYRVTKIVQINGCRDSAFGSYYLTFQDTFQQNLTFCTGDTVFVGSHAHTSVGVYRDTLRGSFGCDSIVVTTLSPVPLHAVITPANPTVCHNDPVVLTASGGIAYAWSNLAQTATIVVTPQSVTIYEVTVTYAAHCSATGSVTVYPVSHDTMSLTQSQASICSNDSAVICAAPGFRTYVWNNGDSTRCITTARSGYYVVTATSSGGCPAVSDSARISIYPADHFAISQKADTLSVTGHFAHCQWFLNNRPIAGDTTAVIVAGLPGSYTVEVNDSNGCTSYTKGIVLSGLNDLGAEGHVLVYPNPGTTGNWHVDIIEQLVGARCEIFDAQGKMVYNGYLKSTGNIVSIKVLSGMYIMKISSAGSAYNIKLVQY